jgi:polyketide biosynthesis acyl carrier protein
MSADVERTLREVIAEILPDVAPAEITPDKSLRDLGADSVDRVEIIMLLTGRLGVSAPLFVFAGIPNIGALIAYLTVERV